MPESKAKDPQTKKINLEKLGEYFDPSDVEWRAQRSGVNQKTRKAWVMAMPYITNRGVMHRLDEVCGPDGWRNEYQDAPGKSGGVICGISIKVSDEWITKWDGAENTSVEAVKGGLSNSMKRAAVQWGIGRYLYMLEAQYVEVKDKGQHYISQQEKKQPYFVPAFKGYWDDPKLPAWALPGSKEQGPRNFKWTDPQDLEVSTPEIEAQRKEEARAAQQKELDAKRASSDQTPTAAKPAQDPRITRFQELMHLKVRPEAREIFIDAALGIPRPKTMGQIEMLIAILEKRADRPDLQAPDPVVDDDVKQDKELSDDDLDAAMDGLEGGGK